MRLNNRVVLRVAVDFFLVVVVPVALTAWFRQSYRAGEISRGVYQLLAIGVAAGGGGLAYFLDKRLRHRF